MLFSFNYIKFSTIILSILVNANFSIISLVQLAESRVRSWEETTSSNSHLKLEADKLLEIGTQKFRSNQYQEALNIYQQVLVIRQVIGDRKGIAEINSEIGIVYGRIGEYSQSLKFLEVSLDICQQLDDKACIGKVFHEMGRIYAWKGEYSTALKLYQQSLSIRQQINDKAGTSSTLNSIGTIYRKISSYSQALEFYQQSLNISTEIGDRAIIGSVLTNIAIVYTSLGQHSQAMELYQQALAIRRELKDRSGEANTLHNIGWAYIEQSNYSKALEFYQQALAIRRAIGERGSIARTLNNIGSVYQKQGKYVQALEVLKESLSIFQELAETLWIGDNLDTIGSAYKGLNQFDRALDSYQQALAIIKEVGDRRIECLILSNIGEVLAKQNQPEMAIVFYKLSVNVTESIRSDLHSLPAEQQRSYTTTVADTYRRLADLLLQQDRVLEAQQVLDLLKIQEIEDYLHSVRGNEQTAQGIPLTPQEQQIRNRHNEILNREIQLGRKLAELEKIPVANRTPQQQQEIANLRQMQQEMRGRFNEFINSPEIVALIQQLSNARAQTVNLAQLNIIRGDILQPLEKKAVLIQPLILENRLELVITTAESPPFRRTVTVKKPDLNQAILQFRIALENPKSDARIPAKKLYDLLIEPLEKDLTEAQAKSIIYAPDGQLRYIPLAALYDGKQWLGQRFAINNITAMSLTKFTGETVKPRILAGAFAAGRYNFERGTTRFAFSGLQFAGLEVENLAAMVPGTTKLIDREFNRAMIPRLPDYTIIHWATHAMFVTGQPEDSFILLGNGDLITMPDIKSLNLLNVDLVVLSACQTGIGGKLGNGEEILGFGYQIQETGAKAAIASLWKVDDGGTQALMVAFYTALLSGNNKAEALQKAQIALITGDDSVLGRSGNLSILAQTRSGLKPSVVSRLHHPYYWAPFILIGNGL